MKLSIEREKLLAILKENRAAHRAIFAEAVDGYRKEAIKILEAHIEEIKNGSLKRVYVTLPQPEEHTNDYDRVIALIEMSTDAAIPLNDIEFASYVQDDWDWKRQFLGSNKPYSSTAAMMYSAGEN